MRVKIKGDNIVIDYSSYGEILHIAEFGKSCLSPGQRSSRKTGRKDFSGSASFKEAIEKAKKGYPEIVPKIAKKSKELFRKISSWVTYKENIEYDVTGHGIDIPKFVEGLPECCIKIDYEHGLGSLKGKMITISIPITYLASQTEEKIKAHGVRIVTLVNLLTLSGFSTRIIGSAFNHSSSGKDMVIGYHIPLKEPDQPLDLNRLTFVMCHPSFLRTIIFSVNECMPGQVVEDIGFYEDSGYGITDKFNPNLCSFKPDLFIEPLGFYKCNDDESWLKKQVEALGKK